MEFPNDGSNFTPSPILSPMGRGKGEGLFFRPSILSFVLCALCASVAVLGLLNGCIARWIAGGAKPATGVYAWDESRRELERKYPADFEKSWQAATNAVEQLLFSREDATRDALGGCINARRIDGTPIKISFDYISEQVTSVRIKVGLYGEKDISERIHDHIRKNLGIAD